MEPRVRIHVRMKLQALGIFIFSACHATVSSSHCLRQASLSVSATQLSPWGLTSLSLDSLWILLGWIISFLYPLFCLKSSQPDLLLAWGFLLPWQLNSLEAIVYSWTLFANAEGAVLGFSPTPKNGAGLTLGYPRSLLATEMSL